MRIFVTKKCTVTIRYTEVCGDGCCAWDEYDTSDFHAGQILIFREEREWNDTIRLDNFSKKDNRDDPADIYIPVDEIEELIEAGTFQKM